MFRTLLLVCFFHLLAFYRATQAYFTLDEEALGTRDYRVSNGNPLKGLIANPQFWYDPNIESIDSSMDIYYIPVGNIMRDDPDIVGPELAFDWKYVEDRLELSGKKHRHAVLTFAVHYPGTPLSMPGHLKRNTNKVDFHWYDEFMGGGLTPNYGNEALIKALTQFVRALGNRYDGDRRIAFFHLGLLGFWGEWHTFPLLGLVPQRSKDAIAGAFRDAFKITKLQARYPDSGLDDFGYYDGSFAFNTLDGEANGGIENKEWYFWPVVEKLNQTSFWRTTPMGGETRPEIQHMIFEDSYPRRTFEHQDFEEAVAVTHATYMMHSDAFIEGGYNGTELDNALRGHCFLGYNFIVDKVTVIESKVGSGLVDVAVTIQQIGVAPFYYQLDVKLDCPDLASSRKLGGLNMLVDNGSRATQVFRDIPATAQCLGALSISLDSPMLLPGRQIKFSQGTGFLNISVPLPSSQDPDDDVDELAVDEDSQPEGPFFVHPSSENSPQNATATVEDELQIEIFYLASKENGVDLWMPLSDQDVVMAPSFGLSLEARPTQPVSSIWFTYGPASMKVENVPPYSLDSNSYLNSAGVKTVVATAFESGRSVALKSLSFEVVATKTTDGIRLPSTAQKLSTRQKDVPYTKHELKKVNYTAHGFNSPYAPSLLQLVALEKAGTSSGKEDYNTATGGPNPEYLSGSAMPNLILLKTALLLAFVYIFA